MLSLYNNEKFFILLIIFIRGFFIFLFIFNNLNINNFFIYGFSKLFFLGKLSSKPLRFISLKEGLIRVKRIDKGWYEYRGPIGFKTVFYNLSLYNKKYQIVLFLTQYIIFFIIFIFLLLFFIYLGSSTRALR